MKVIKSEVNYTVPHWNYCNSDNLINGGELTKNVCRFCVKSKANVRCVLYDEALRTDGEYIYKTGRCCRATAGFKEAIDVPPPVPTIPPKDIMKQTIELYSKTMNDLIAQGYPRPMAEQAAKKYILGG